jgi:hypothetical protein
MENIDTMFDLVLGGILTMLTLGTLMLAWWVRTTEV